MSQRIRRLLTLASLTLSFLGASASEAPEMDRAIAQNLDFFMNFDLIKNKELLEMSPATNSDPRPSATPETSGQTKESRHARN